MTKPKWPRKQCKSFQIPLFGGEMCVFYDRDSYQQALDHLDVYSESIEGFDGLVMHLEGEKGGCCYLVGIFEHKDDIVCHESVHVAQFVMDRAGSSDNETQAYLTQRVFADIMKNLPEESKIES